jgi:hypothetical protein
LFWSVADIRALAARGLTVSREIATTKTNATTTLVPSFRHCWTKAWASGMVMSAAGGGQWAAKYIERT